MSTDMIPSEAKRNGIGYHAISRSDYGMISLERNPARSGREPVANYRSYTNSMPDLSLTILSILIEQSVFDTSTP